MNCPIYIYNDVDDTQWCVEDLEDIQLESLVLKDALRTMVRILWDAALDLNDALTRKFVADRGNAYLTERYVSRLTAYGKVICDASNNPPSRVDANQIVATICIKAYASGELYHQFSLSNKPFGVQQ